MMILLLTLLMMSNPLSLNLDPLDILFNKLSYKDIQILALSVVQNEIPSIETLKAQLGIEELTEVQEKLIKKHIRKAKAYKKKEDKIKYRSEVRMTKMEYDTLLKKFGKITLEEKIDCLQEWKMSTGKRKKCDYSTILIWNRSPNPYFIQKKDVTSKNKNILKGLFK